ncbi:MAG: Hsp20/alpha crystallin family protein [Parcubacteria group bacterium]
MDMDMDIKKDFPEFEPEAPQADLAVTHGSKDKNKKIVKKTSNGKDGQLTVDVFQTEDDIVIKSTIAGVTAEDIDVSITNDMVTIKGHRKTDETVSGSNYYHQELYWGAFSRSVILPEEIDADKAIASMKNGILTLRLPKLTRSRVKKLKVRS